MTHRQCVHGQYPHCKRCSDLHDQGDADNALVQAASRPKLADLYKKAQAKGLMLKRSNYN